MTETFQIELTPEQITTPNSNPATIQIGDIKLCDKKTFTLTFPSLLFDTIKAKTYLWKVDPASNEMNHNIHAHGEKTFNPKNPKASITLEPRCVSEEASIVLKIFTRKISKEIPTNVSIKIGFSSSPNGITIDENDTELVCDKTEKPIGEGGEAKIFGGLFRGEKVVVKEFFEFTNTKEMDILKQLRHPNLIEILGIFYSGNERHINIIMKRAIGSLDKLYLQQSDVMNCTMLQHVAKGLQFIHSQNYVHLDMKPQNVLVFDTNDGLVAKVCDMGVAERVNWDEIKTTPNNAMIGTIFYMAPEMYVKKQFCKQSDVFAYGRMVYAILKRMSENELKCESGEIMKSVEKKPPVIYNYNNEEISKEMHPKLQEIIQKCCEVEIEKRTYTFDDAIKALEIYKEIMKTEEDGIQNQKYRIDLGTIDLLTIFEGLVRHFDEIKNINDPVLVTKLIVSSPSFNETMYEKLGEYVKKAVVEDKKDAKTRGGELEYIIGETYQKRSDSYAKKHSIECFISAAKKGHVDAYIKLANEMRRIVEGLKNKTIVEEKE